MVPSCGIEPQPSEPESEILSIKLRGRRNRKYNEKSTPIDYFLLINFSGFPEFVRDSLSQIGR